MNPIWLSTIPHTWQSGYLACLTTVAAECRQLIERDAEAKDLWKFLRALAYAESDTPDLAADPIEHGWIPTRNGNYRRTEGDARLVIFHNLSADGTRTHWGYGINQKYAEEVFVTWQDAHAAVFAAISRGADAYASAS